MIKKDPKYMVKNIENEYKNYLDIYGDNNIDQGIQYFSYMLREFYDYSAKYFEIRHNYEKKLELPYKDTLNCYLSTFNVPYIYLYNNKVSKENTNFSILDDLVYEVRKKIGLNKDGGVINTEQQCGIASLYFRNASKKYGIKADIVNTTTLLGLLDYGRNNRAHAFNLVTIEGKKYIVDCTFSQFTKLFYMTPHVIKLPMFINAEPAYFLNQTKQGKELLDKILKYGYFEVNDENLKLYLDSFVLSERNAFYYLDGGNMYDTKIDSSYYFDILNSDDINHYSPDDEIPLIFGSSNQIGSAYKKILNKEQLHKLDKIID